MSGAGRCGLSCRADKNPMVVRWPVPVLLALTAPLGAQDLDREQPNVNEFLQTYLAESKPIYQYLDNIRIRARHKAPGEGWLDYWLAVRSGKRVWGTFRTEYSQKAERITSDTPNYMFQIFRGEKCAPQLKFVLRKEEIERYLRHSYLIERGYPTVVPVSVLGIVELRDAILSPEFSFSVAPNDGPKGSHVIVLKDQRADPLIREAKVFLDQKRQWAISRVEAAFDWKTLSKNAKGDLSGSVEVDVDYQDGLSKYVPARIVARTKARGSRVWVDNWEVSEVTVGDVQDSEFRLSKYGLSDVPIEALINDGGDRRSSWFKWTCIGAIAVFIVVQIAVLHRRRTAP